MSLCVDSLQRMQDAIRHIEGILSTRDVSREVSKEQLYDIYRKLAGFWDAASSRSPEVKACYKQLKGTYKKLLGHFPWFVHAPKEAAFAPDAAFIRKLSEQFIDKYSHEPLTSASFPREEEVSLSGEDREVIAEEFIQSAFALMHLDCKRAGNFVRLGTTRHAGGLVLTHKKYNGYIFKTTDEAWEQYRRNQRARAATLEYFLITVMPSQSPIPIPKSRLSNLCKQRFDLYVEKRIPNLLSAAAQREFWSRIMQHYGSEQVAAQFKANLQMLCRQMRDFVWSTNYWDVEHNFPLIAEDGKVYCIDFDKSECYGAHHGLAALGKKFPLPELCGASLEAQEALKIRLKALAIYDELGMNGDEEVPPPPPDVEGVAKWLMDKIASDHHANRNRPLLTNRVITIEPPSGLAETLPAILNRVQASGTIITWGRIQIPRNCGPCDQFTIYY